MELKELLRKFTVKEASEILGPSRRTIERMRAGYKPASEKVYIAALEKACSNRKKQPSRYTKRKTK